MRFWRRLRQMVGGRRFEEELAEELRIHREMAAEAGAEPVAFGSIALTMEDSRAVWRVLWLDSLTQDIRYALRGFRKSPGFALTVIGTLALGLGMLATAFSVFNAAVLRPFPVRDPGSLYSAYFERKEFVEAELTWQEYTELRRQNGAFSEIVATQWGSAAVAGRNLFITAASGNYFSMLGVRVCQGRPLVGADDAPGGAAAVVSYEAWKNDLGGGSDILGRKLYPLGQPVEVVGVACPGFTGLENFRTGFWVSLGFSGVLGNGPDLFGPASPARLMVTGRLKQGMTPASGRAALLASARQMANGRREVARVTLSPNGMPDRFDDHPIRRYLPLLAAFGLVLLAACANASNMMLARAMARQREFGARIALGAGRGRLIRQLLTESLLLAAASAAGGCAVVLVATRAVNGLLLRLAPAQARIGTLALDYAPDFRVIGFLLAAAVATVLFFGLAPAIQTTRSSPISAMRGGFSHDRRPARLRSALVIAQAAACALLLIAAAVVWRGERRLTRQDRGLETHGVFAIRPVDRFRDAVLQRLAAEPSAGAIAAAVWMPMWGSPGMVNVAGASQPIRVDDSFVSPGYFDVFRIPILRGRRFSQQEADTEAPVAIVSDASAKRLWPQADALGQTLAVPGVWLVAGARRRPAFRAALVVGVAGNVIQGWEGKRPQTEFVYFPGTLEDPRNHVLLVRSKESPGATRRALESVIGQVAPGAAEIDDMDNVGALQFYQPRILLAIAGMLGGLVLLLTVSGIYSVLAYVVGQRRKEIGIRIALGADGSEVTRMVLRQALRLAGIGAAIGILLALWAGRIMAHQIEPIEGFDLGGFAGGELAVIAAALAASWVPARRAVKVDPAVTLRCD